MEGGLGGWRGGGQEGCPPCRAGLGAGGVPIEQELQCACGIKGSS